MRQRKIYVASSWRNEGQPIVVARLREEGHLVYDFKNPTEGDHGFHWTEIDPNYKDWEATNYLLALEHEIANDGFKKDFDAMEWADTCVLVLPCGRSAHLEAGWMMGSGRQLFIVLQPEEHPVKELVPELMYKMATSVVVNTGELLSVLRES